MNLFLTGGTGSVGLEFLRLALATERFDQVRVLMRAESQGQLEARWARLVSLASDGRARAQDLPHWKPMQGDVTAPRLGVTDADQSWLRGHTTHIVHAAAAIDFTADRSQVHPVNVDGTRRVLDLAHRSARLVSMAHVSTLYVAGRRTGLIREEELEHGAGFVNAYEASKYEAEQLVRHEARNLPLAVYRLSLLMGRAADGYVHQRLEAHKMFELFLSGKARRVPGHASHTLDMLPTDYAVGILYDLFLSHFTPGATLHISAGASAPTGADLVEACRRHLEQPDWGVEWMNAAEWAQVRDSEEADTHGISPAAHWMFEVVGDYLLLPKHFCRNGTDALFGSRARVPPRAVDYLPGILDQCAASNWGRA